MALCSAGTCDTSPPQPAPAGGGRRSPLPTTSLLGVKVRFHRLQARRRRVLPVLAGGAPEARAPSVLRWRAGGARAQGNTGAYPDFR
ncbi:MAG: hypothetical protein KatS3mg056_2198 [Chloroflexus sp.]|jgi:hypothetical protein|nr:MAG: hypothetical protein KatS3mg056_2198 [Chloroflexus sp.]